MPTCCEPWPGNTYARIIYSDTTGVFRSKIDIKYTNIGTLSIEFNARLMDNEKHMAIAAPAGSGTPETPPVVWMFSGQGSQYFHMGRALYERCRYFSAWMDRLDQTAMKYLECSIVSVIYDQARRVSDPFGDITLSHPALFMVQLSLANALIERGFAPPRYLLGASLGEFVAAAFAGVDTPEALLFDIIKQATLFKNHCTGGAMLVVLDDVEEFHRNPDIYRDIDLAGVNFDRCFVVSGPSSTIQRITEALKTRDVPHQRLPVEVGFHSRAVDALAPLFRDTFRSRQYQIPAYPLISCSHSRVDRFTVDYWWEVIRRPIRFRESFRAFLQQHPQASFVDIGPSGTLATFARYNTPSPGEETKIFTLLNPFGQDIENIEACQFFPMRT